MTLSQIETDIYYRMNKNASNIDTLTQNRIRNFVNQRHRELLTIPDASALRDDVLTFASVADQAPYGFAQAVARINRIWQADHERVLEERPLDWYRSVAPDPSAITGDPEYYIIGGLSRTAVALAATNSVWVKSSSGSDTTQTVTVQFTNNDQLNVTLTVTLNGTTAVQFGSSSNRLAVNNWYLSATCAGSVTLHEGSGTGTQLGIIPAGQTSGTFATRLFLFPTPASVLTYTMDYTRRILDMSAAHEEPFLPEDFHRALIYGACADECLHMNDPRYSVFKQEWGAAVADLKYWLHARPGYRPGGRWNEQGRGGGSNLGAWFPAGRW